MFGIMLYDLLSSCLDILEAQIIAFQVLQLSSLHYVQ